MEIDKAYFNLKALSFSQDCLFAIENSKRNGEAIPFYYAAGILCRPFARIAMVVARAFNLLTHPWSLKRWGNLAVSVLRLGISLIFALPLAILIVFNRIAVRNKKETWRDISASALELWVAAEGQFDLAEAERDADCKGRDHAILDAENIPLQPIKM